MRKATNINVPREAERLMALVNSLSTISTSVKVTPWSELCKQHGLAKRFIGVLFKKLQEAGFVEITGCRSGIQYKKLKSIAIHEATLLIDKFHLMPGNSQVSLLSKIEGPVKEKTETNLAIDKENTQKPQPITTISNQYELGKKYFFLYNNLIGYGILKTIEAILDDVEEVVTGYRYELRVEGKSFISTTLYKNITDVSNQIMK